MNIISYYQNSSLRQTFRVLVLANVLCALLVATRLVIFHNYGYFFLIWNLFLAGLPLAFAFIFHFLCETYEKAYVTKSLTLFLWLLFLPNSPYIITDLIHIAREVNVPVWFDASLLFCSAITGLIMGFLSLFLIHQKIKEQLTSGCSWAFITFLLALSSYGIYLGRVLRWNSWDLFTRPVALFKSIFETIILPSALSMTIVFSVMLSLLYVMFYSLLDEKFK